MQIKQIIEILESDKCRNFLKENKSADPVNLLLNKQLSAELPLKPLAEILHLYNKAQKKLPLWVESFCALSSKSYEQSSSELAAKFKAGLVKGKNLLNMTGGLGVDDYFFSKRFSHVDSIEIDEDIHEMAQYNLHKLEATNVKRIHADSVEWMKQNDLSKYDMIFIDPDRRPSAAGKNYFLEDCIPNILELKDQLLEGSRKLMIKASPMLDISRALKQLETVHEVKVVSVNNEVKELLFILTPEPCSDVQIEAVELSADATLRFSKTINHETLADAGQFFIDMGPALTKANLINEYADHFELEPCYMNSPYAFCTHLKCRFGRLFKVKTILDFNKKALQRYLTTQNLVQANVARRNFPLTVKEIRKKFGIKDGGELYLFFYCEDDGAKKVVVCERP